MTMAVLVWIVVGMNLASMLSYFGMTLWRNNERRRAQADYLRAGTSAGSIVYARGGPATAPPVAHAGTHPGVVRGWRGYSFNDGVLVGSVLPWRTAQLTARCAEGHAAPDPTCGCGIYVLRTRDQSAREMPGRLQAEVVAWGEVIECCPHGAICTDANCVTGWRAEHVRIERVHVWEDDQYTAAIIRGRYGVEVVCDVQDAPIVWTTFNWVLKP